MNAIVKDFEARLDTIKAWRHHLHQHPELSFDEVNTSRYIADLVKSWGYDVVERIGKHGVVASMTAKLCREHAPRSRCSPATFGLAARHCSARLI